MSFETPPAHALRPAPGVDFRPGACENRGMVGRFRDVQPHGTRVSPAGAGMSRREAKERGR